MRKTSVIYAMLCVLFINYPTFAQNPKIDTDDPVTKAQRLMVRQKYAEASKEIRSVLAKDPRNIHALYTLAAIEQTRILDYESYTIEGRRFQVLADSLKKVIEAQMPRLRGADSVQAYFYTASLVGGIGIMQAKRGDWIDGARNAMSSVGMYRQIKKLDPGHLGADMGTGVFDYYLGSAFKWVPFVTGASAERGFEAIKRAQEAPFPFNHAARNTYCWILIDRKEFKTADSIARAALNEMPDNTVFLRIRALIALWRGDNKSAVTIGEKLRAASQNRTPVNWSDLLTAYYIKAAAYEKLGQKTDAYNTASEALDMQIPAAYRNIPHVKEHIKNINSIRNKNRPK